MEKKATILVSNDNPSLTTTLWLDVIRFLAIAWVIIIHAAGILLYQPISAKWWVGNFYDSIARPAVPLFIMLSGALLLDANKIESIREFYLKRVVKLVVPLIVWSFIYLSLTAYEAHKPLHFIGAFQQILQAPAMYHLGFMYIILGLYLIVPIMQVYVNAASINNMIYFMGLWFVVNSLLALLAKTNDIHLAIQFVGINGFIGYYVGGFLLKNYDFTVTAVRQKIILYCLIGMSLGMTMIGTYYYTHASGSLDEFFYEYLSPNIVIMSLSLFVLIKLYEPFFCKLVANNPYLGKILVLFRSITFGVYFLHVLVLMALSGHLGMHFNALSFNPIFSVPILALITLIISAITVLIIRKIPLVRWLAP